MKKCLICGESTGNDTNFCGRCVDFIRENALNVKAFCVCNKCETCPIADICKEKRAEEEEL